MATVGEIRDAILAALYEAKFTTEAGYRNLTWLRYKERWDKKAFRTAIEPIRSLLDRVGTTDEYGLSIDGVVVMEEQGLAPPDLHDRNERCRAAMLRRLAHTYREAGPHQCAIRVPTLLACDTDRALAEANLRVLIHEGLAFETEPMVSCRITLRGLRVAEGERERCDIADELDRIEALEPHLRRRPLTQCFARLARRDGWDIDGGGDSPDSGSDALDLVIGRGREFYLVDCRWTEAPVGADVASRLVERAGRRPGTNGILVSMAGFDGACSALVRESRAVRLVLMFGPADLRSLAGDGARLEDPLTEKHRALMGGDVLWR